MSFWGFVFVLLSVSTLHSQSQKLSDDQPAMEAILKNIQPKPPTNWSSGSDCCSWGEVSCQNGKVTSIMIKEQSLSGTLHPDINKLTSLQRLHIMRNNLTGSFPTLQGLSQLQQIYANDNNFTYFPANDFFSGLDSLQEFRVENNPFQAWQIPDSVKLASKLTTFTASNANISGNIPEFFGINSMPSLMTLQLAYNNLDGELPASFSGSGIRTLWLNNNNKLNGTVSVLQNMTSLTQVWLHGNQFTGPLPEFSELNSLRDLNLESNKLTGIVPLSLQNLNSLQDVSLSSNLLQGPMPSFSNIKQVDVTSNNFCTKDAGTKCDPRVTILLSIAKDMGYPSVFAEKWIGNDPCGDTSDHWFGVTCSGKGDITVLNFPNNGLTGTISSNFSLLTSLSRLILRDNNLTGVIPQELTKLQNLEEIDLSNNNLYGKVPSFRENVVVKLGGNPDIGKDHPSGTVNGGGNKKSRTGVIVGVVMGGVVGALLAGLLTLCYFKRKQRRSGTTNSLVIHPRHSGDQNAVKITIANRVNGFGSENRSEGPNDIHVQAGNMIISIQVLRSVTNNFNEGKVLGKGGFGTVYEGELHDGTKIAVKRMESGVVAEKGLHEFKSEIAVLTKVRHRHLVGLLGYCLDGNERLLVFEHMPQGTLSRHLFNWKEEGLKPLDWTRRLTIALDVARGVQYLHGLANDIFIHRDLKPSNILLGDDMRAKVADFGLVRLAPAGKASIETRLAGTFGYLAPEYAATGRMTLKVDVYSFGVILMELITGRKAIDESQPGESCHLVTWFRRKLNALPEIVDPTIYVNNEETFSSICTVAELAGHCSAREPYQRPDIGHAVNVLSSLVEQWKPSKQEDFDEMDAINFDVPLNEAVKMWQAAEGKSNIDESLSSSFFPSGDDTTQTSIPHRPSGFAESFTSSDGR